MHLSLVVIFLCGHILIGVHSQSDVCERLRLWSLTGRGEQSRLSVVAKESGVHEHYTVCFWLRLTVVVPLDRTISLFSYSDNTNHLVMLLLRTSNDVFHFRLIIGSDVFETDNFSTARQDNYFARWHHLCLKRTFQATAWHYRLRWDDKESVQASQQYTTSSFRLSVDDTIIIGNISPVILSQLENSAQPTPFAGMVAGIRIYHEIVSETEITSIFDCQLCQNVAEMSDVFIRPGTESHEMASEDYSTVPPCFRLYSIVMTTSLLGIDTGTSDPISFSLVGSQGTTSTFSYRGGFSGIVAGNVNTINLHLYQLGAISKIRLSKNGSDDWSLSRVSVTAGKDSWHFDYDEWIPSDQLIGYFQTTCKDKQCYCLPGFAALDNVCQEIDECASSPCNHGNCLDLVNGFYCTCPPGVTGHLCQTREPCFSNPCVRGICSSNQLTYTCVCPPGYTGRQCTTRITTTTTRPQTTQRQLITRITTAGRQRRTSPRTTQSVSGLGFVVTTASSDPISFGEDDSEQMDEGTETGVGVAAAIVSLLLIAGVAFLYRKRKHTRTANGQNNGGSAVEMNNRGASSAPGAQNVSGNEYFNDETMYAAPTDLYSELEKSDDHNEPVYSSTYDTPLEAGRPEDQSATTYDTALDTSTSPEPLYSSAYDAPLGAAKSGYNTKQAGVVVSTKGSGGQPTNETPELYAAVDMAAKRRKSSCEEYDDMVTVPPLTKDRADDYANYRPPNTGKTESAEETYYNVFD